MSKNRFTPKSASRAALKHKTNRRLVSISIKTELHESEAGGKDRRTATHPVHRTAAFERRSQLAFKSKGAIKKGGSSSSRPGATIDCLLEINPRSVPLRLGADHSSIPCHRPTHRFEIVRRRRSFGGLRIKFSCKKSQRALFVDESCNRTPLPLAVQQRGKQELSTTPSITSE